MDIQSTFKRVEQKYVLNEKQYKIIKNSISKHFDKDKYPTSKIYNIYFDNDNNDLIINSLEKPIYKEKFRVRKYGDSGDIFLEMKQKYKSIVYKRRVILTQDEYDAYFEDGTFPSHDKQIMKEIDYYMKYYNLKPFMMVAYDRESFLSRDDSNFRLTFDHDLRSRHNKLTLEDDESDKMYFSDKKWIMELKSTNNLPLWFIDVLSNNGIYPISFSKIGNIYKKERGSV